MFNSARLDVELLRERTGVGRILAELNLELNVRCVSAGFENSVLLNLKYAKLLIISFFLRYLEILK